jgi:hypothetical protein
LLCARDFFSTALSIRNSSSFSPQICSNHQAAAAHEQMVDLTRASSNPPASSIGINLLVLSPVKICCDEICIVILLSVLRSFFWLSQNYSAGKLLVILGVEWQNIFLCSCNQFNF